MTELVKPAGNLLFQSAEKNADQYDSKTRHSVANPWQLLSQFTDARIGLGRAGVSVPTQALLDFQLAHAQAQDAVHCALDVDALQQTIATELDAESELTAALKVHSAAKDRAEYLQRPDLGRRLNPTCLEYLSKHAAAEAAPYDLAIVMADGLSSFAVQKTAPRLLAALNRRLTFTHDLCSQQHVYRIAPYIIVRQGRVAIADEIGQSLHAKAVVILIGERPGLSASDSLGLYYTWAPKVGLTDASRNCISNIRPGGLSIDEAVDKLCYLIVESRRQQLSGIALKENAAHTLSAQR